MPLQLPNFSGHRTKKTYTFSERQRQRKANALSEEVDEFETPGSLPVFRGHRSKDKQTFSERQRLRKIGELPEDTDPHVGHRTKDWVTFSEQQRLRKKGRPLPESVALEFIDGPYSARWSEYSSSDQADSSDLAVAGYFGDDGFSGSSEEEMERQMITVPEDGEAGAKTSVLAQPAKAQRRKAWIRSKLKLGASGIRLISGAIAGGVSRTAVAPLETIRTHLMVGGKGEKSVGEVFNRIMKSEGWKGLYRGNALNVLRVAPSKAIELFMYDTVKRTLTPKDGSRPLVPVSPIAGSAAGIASCVLTYPLELVKTRLTIQPGHYTGVVNAFCKIASEEGFLELYRGLVPSVIGVIPYAGANYYAYDTLRTLYKKVSKKDKISNLATLVIGSTAGAIASSATFPLEVARKQMQVGALQGRVVYKGTLHALQCILKEQGLGGLYRGLGPSCIKLMPAAGISFMCYEALKRVLMDEDEAAT